MERRWQPPGCGPVEYLDRLGLLIDRLLAVHGVQLTDGELARLAAAGATVVDLPAQQRWTGAGTPPIERFYESGVRVAIGTDSLASVEDLEPVRRDGGRPAARARRAGGRILRSATLDGAEALGFGTSWARSSRGSARSCSRSASPTASRMWKNIWSSGVEPASDVGWLSDTA